MKKNLRFIIPAAAILLLAVIFGIMYIVGSSGNGADNSTAPSTEATQPTITPTEEPANFVIGIMQFDDTIEYADVYDEFIAALEHRGFIEGKNVEYLLENAAGDSEKCQTMAENLVDQGVDIIFAIAEENAVAAYSATKDIPIVFGAVNDPKEAGLVESNEVPGANVTGVSDYSPSREQMDLIMEVFPETQTVAVIYNELDESSVTQVSLAEVQAQENGMAFEKYPIDESADLGALVGEISEQAQIIYLPNDELLIERLDSIVTAANEKGIPVVGGNEEMVLKGCTLAYGIDYKDVGKNSAIMVVEILQNGGVPANMPVSYLNELILYVNTEAQNSLGFEIDESLESKTVNLETQSVD